MRKLVVGMFMSLDGVVQAPGGPDEDREGGFEHGGWTVPFFDEQLGQYLTEMISRSDALLLGRKTYDIFASSWPLAPDDDPIGAHLNSVPKYVASRTMKTADWNNTTILSGDVAEEVRKLKEGEGGEIQMAGSSDLIQTLLKHDLIDEFHLLIYPVLLGNGKRLFGEGTVPGNLKLTNTMTTANGVMINNYERAGDLQYGAMGYEIE